MRMYRIAKVEQPNSTLSQTEIDALLEKASQFTSADEFIENVMPEYAKYDSEDDFMEYHRTGGISSSAYKNYEKTGGLSWVGNVERFPKLIGTIETKKGTVEVRQEGTKNEYVKTDENRDIVRGPDGMALMMSDEEIERAGLPVYDTAVVGFNEEGRPIALVSDEFGSDGVWVEGDYQGLGLGTAMLHEFRKQFRPKRRIGQMTYAGDRMSRKFYRRMEDRAQQLKSIWESVNDGSDE